MNKPSIFVKSRGKVGKRPPIQQVRPQPRRGGRGFLGQEYTQAPTGLPVDLIRKHRIALPTAGGKDFGGDLNDIVGKISDNVEILASTTVLERGLVAQVFNVTTTPVLVVDGIYRRGYIFLNPTPPVGLTANGTIFASAFHAALATGDSTATPVGVASYRTARFWLDISASTGGAVKVDLLSRDPLTLNWADVPGGGDIFASPIAVGTYYANVGNVGVDSQMALRFTVSAAGTSTFSVSYLLKDGLPGGPTGLSNTVFLGANSNVNSQTGFPLIEGATFEKYFRENTQLWAVSLSATGTNLTRFELQ